jgi:hypothetical protein
MTDTSPTVQPVVGSHQTTARFSGVFEPHEKRSDNFFADRTDSKNWTSKRTPKELKGVKNVNVR